MSVEDENAEVHDGSGLPASDAEASLGPSSDQPACPNPQCRYDKHEKDANFCILCGTLLYTHCEDCLAHSPTYARFCHHCGTDLAELRELRQLEKE